MFTFGLFGRYHFQWGGRRLPVVGRVLAVGVGIRCVGEQPRPNVIDWDYQVLCNKVCRLVPGMTAEQWYRFSQDQRAVCMADALASVAPKVPDMQRIEVSLDRMEITLDGTSYPCTSEQALRMLRVYASSPGQWFTAKQVEKEDTLVSADKVCVLKAKLPTEVQRLLKGHTHHGTRLVLPLLQ